MVLRGELDVRYPPLLVTNADPGMENAQSYPHIERMKQRCVEAGIAFTSVKTGLFYDLVTFKERGLSRLDNPPYWTRNRITGKKGRLKQDCTAHYKIAAMRRELRKFLFQRFSVSLVTKRVPLVEMWIGFTSDEQSRVDQCVSDVQYVRLRFPLAELGFTKAKVVGYYLQHGIAQPPPSVCNACYANGLAFLEDMYQNRPDDWEQAVQVDEAIRDMRSLGVEDECFVSETLIPLRELPSLNFKRDDVKYFQEHRCNSGVCFV